MTSKNTITALQTYDSIHDLPQLYQKPTFEELVQTLELLKLVPTSFSCLVDNQDRNDAGDDGNDGNDDGSNKANSFKDNSSTKTKAGNETSQGSHLLVVDPTGAPRYLTSIVASPLSWLANDTERETIWDMASARLSERAGRTAMPSMTRRFEITDHLVIELYEPSLTEDNLGLKTWTSSLLLARRLPSFQKHIPPRCRSVLELGSGTGLVGIAAACIFRVSVDLTDLPEIVPNLEKNVRSNMHLATERGGGLAVKSLDWSDDTSRSLDEGETYEIVVAADPIYSSDHPRIFVNAVNRWLRKSGQSRFILELPLRRGYERERTDLRNRLQGAGLELVDEGFEIGYDDWQGKDGRQSEVECWWSVWRPDPSN